MTRRATATAGSNIALVKYWGKRSGSEPGLNLPAVGSLSLTLDRLTTRTTLEWDDALREDSFVLEDPSGRREDPTSARRVRRFLDLVRQGAGLQSFARVKTRNDFPTGAGLASSASGFAALALAATRAAGWKLEARELSQLARQGSGSAARSIFGGFVELHRGQRDDGRDCFAEPLAAPEHWPLRVIVAVTRGAAKDVGSTEGMQHTQKTSPAWTSWVETHEVDLDEARAAILGRDFERLATVTESSCLKMHATMMSARPGLLYWRGATVELIHVVREMRREGVPVCFTIDAGPQLKAICPAEAEEQVVARLQSVPGVEQVLVSGLGAGVTLVEAP